MKTETKDVDAGTRDEREAFEAWCDKEGVQTERHPRTGVYCYPSARVAWRSWQGAWKIRPRAALATAPEQAGEQCKVSKWSSRVCEWGTKSCELYHTAPPPASTNRLTDGQIAEQIGEPETRDEVPVEIWHGDRKVTIYADSVLRSWGPHIGEQMSDTPRTLQSVQDSIDWLYAPHVDALTALAEDARRYRYLRDVHIGDDPEAIELKPSKKYGLDAAIDAAIIAATEGK